MQASPRPAAAAARAAAVAALAADAAVAALATAARAACESDTGTASPRYIVPRRPPAQRSCTAAAYRVCAAFACNTRRVSLTLRA
jgi:hypothetical protein